MTMLIMTGLVTTKTMTTQMINRVMLLLMMVVVMLTTTMMKTMTMTKFANKTKTIRLVDRPSLRARQVGDILPRPRLQTSSWRRHGLVHDVKSSIELSWKIPVLPSNSTFSLHCFPGYNCSSFDSCSRSRIELSNLHENLYSDLWTITLPLIVGLLSRSSLNIDFQPMYL